jgi:hypothetical protein
VAPWGIAYWDGRWHVEDIPADQVRILSLGSSYLTPAQWAERIENCENPYCERGLRLDIHGDHTKPCPSCSELRSLAESLGVKVPNAP